VVVLGGSAETVGGEAGMEEQRHGGVAGLPRRGCCSGAVAPARGWR
jgi:hypothetical protein